MELKVICIEDTAFTALITKVADLIRHKYGVAHEPWCSGEEAMKKLGITSKTTLQKFRDEGKIRFAQPSKKVIVYDVKSIDAFLNQNSKNPF